MKIYLSHKIRGKSGPNATDEEIKQNNNIAIKFGRLLKELFPRIDFYIPGEHDEWITKAYRAGIINEKEILDIDCQILHECNAILFYLPDDYFSGGMKIEENYAKEHNILCEYLDDDSKMQVDYTVQHMIKELAKKKIL